MSTTPTYVTIVRPDTHAIFIVRRDTLAGGKRWQRPGYYAVVVAPLGWDTGRPLSPNCMVADGAKIIAREDVRDMRYIGPRSQASAARAAARETAEAYATTLRLRAIDTTVGSN